MVNYQHLNQAQQPIDLPVGKVVCIGQNYQAHIEEMNGKTAPEPLFFIKPTTALVPLVPHFSIPTDQGRCHHEAEIAVLISKPLSKAKPEQVLAAIWGYGIALDLTLRDLQDQLKQLGRPWEVAKGFDGACPVSSFIEQQHVSDPQQLALALKVNNEYRQQESATLMIRSIVELISQMSLHFTLLPGDIILTGSPKGVSSLQIGDQLVLSVHQQDNLLFTLNTEVK